jgi:hypothetical protein
VTAPVVPAVPVSCVGRPTVGGGLVVPWVNTVLADGTVDFRSRQEPRYAESWQRGLCQVCGELIVERAVLLGSVDALARRHFGEPPCCVPCAVYVTEACPLVGGRMVRHPDRPRISHGPRGKTCPVPGCDCGGLVETTPGGPAMAGKAVRPWVAVFVRPTQWQVTVQDTVVFCSDGVCDQPHPRRVVNGGLLVGDPLKVMLVSAPGAGRVWRRLTDVEVAELVCEEGPR